MVCCSGVHRQQTESGIVLGLLYNTLTRLALGMEGFMFSVLLSLPRVTLVRLAHGAEGLSFP